MEIEVGNASAVDTSGSGWFIGYGDWTRSADRGLGDLRVLPRDALARALQVKWMVHPAHDPRGTGKPLSEGRTISLLVSEGGRFRLEFSTDPSFSVPGLVRHTLDRHGDFVIWGPGLHHRWFVDEACTILTLRWTPVPDKHSGMAGGSPLGSSQTSKPGR
ncbi:hypothetical protein NZK33_14875 [Cyanobium sp. FGCU-6]|nr:hypothetical protein [Cyanobium sp. FGCU6]